MGSGRRGQGWRCVGGWVGDAVFILLEYTPNLCSPQPPPRIHIHTPPESTPPPIHFTHTHTALLARIADLPILGDILVELFFIRTYIGFARGCYNHPDQGVARTLLDDAAQLAYRNYKNCAAIRSTNRYASGVCLRLCARACVVMALYVVRC